MFPESSAVHISPSVSFPLRLSPSLPLLSVDVTLIRRNLMSAVMFCGLRRDVGANNVGECEAHEGGDLQWSDCSLWCLIINASAFSSLCLRGETLNYTFYAEITCQSNVAWSFMSLLPAGIFCWWSSDFCRWRSVVCSAICSSCFIPFLSFLHFVLRQMYVNGFHSVLRGEIFLTSAVRLLTDEEVKMWCWLNLLDVVLLDIKPAWLENTCRPSPTNHSSLWF